MLIQFSVSNFKAIYKQQTFSMAAAGYEKSLPQNTFDSDLGQNIPHLLRCAVLYGANAAGKSTLIQALMFVKNLVLQSHRHQIGEAIDVSSFKLFADSRTTDSEFVLHLIEQDHQLQKNVRYEYGFSCNSKRITKEWLYAYPTGRKQTWFERSFDPITQTDHYQFGNGLQGGKKRKDWAEQTLENTLYLSKATQNNQAQLACVFSWFKDRLQIIPSRLPTDYTTRQCDDPDTRQTIVELLQAADFYIHDIQLKTSPLADELPKQLPVAVKQQLLQDSKEKTVRSPRFLHKNIDDATYTEFRLEEESDGTQAFFALIGPWLDAVKNERVLVIDELDTSLHPKLVRFLIEYLRLAQGKGQLLFTTHDTSLLDAKDLFRRDQIWFVEKDGNQSSTFFSLSDFGVRKDESIERRYLSGRYGAVPQLKDIKLYE